MSPHVQPLANGGKDVAPLIELDQYAVPYYTVGSVGQTATGHEAAPGLQVLRSPGSRTINIFGAIGEGQPPDREELAIDDPAEFAAMALRQVLVQRGIQVQGKARADHDTHNATVSFLSELHNDAFERQFLKTGISGAPCLSEPDPGPVLASHTSAPLGEDVTFTLKTSANLHAELMLRALESKTFCPHGSTVAGARMVRAFANQAGIDVNDVTLFDGSGLSVKDVVTPRAETRLLSYAATQPWFAQWKAALPVGGVDGTLASRFTTAPLKGHVLAKTGTLGESRALAGYLECASGKQVVFSIMVDNHPPGSSADRAVMDRIVAAIAAAN